MTSGTFGRTSTGSSTSAALQWSMENRLRALTRDLGSTLYKMTWKPWAMPSGRSRSRLRASVPRTSATAPTGWPTPTASLADKGVRSTEGGILEAMRNHGPDLAAASCLASWATPSARDWHSASASPEFLAERAERAEQTRGKPLSEQAFTLAGWATPTVQNSKHATFSPAAQAKAAKGEWTLCSLAAISDGPARLTASGEMLTGSSAAMDAGGQLSPAHPRWLMGCPAQWDSCSRNYADWRKWQDWIASLSPEQRLSVSKASEGSAMQSTPKPRAYSSKQPCEAA